MLTISADAFSTTTIAPEIAPKKRRRYCPPGPALEKQQFRHVTLPDGAEVVCVALHGRGFGQEMILDAADWLFVRDLGPVAWTLVGAPRSSTGYVCSGVTAIRHLCPPGRSRRPLAILARVLTAAKRSEVVQYRDENPLNLRRGNLVITNRRAFMDALGVARDTSRADTAERFLKETR